MKYLLFVLVESALCAMTKKYEEKWMETWRSVRRQRKDAEEQKGEKKKRVAVVLDGSSETGKKLVEELLNQGYFVIFPNKENIENRQYRCIKAKIEREEAVEVFVKKIEEQEKQIDLLVLNGSTYEKYTKAHREIKGTETRITPSKKKIGFEGSKREYRPADRVMLDKDPNARKNYLMPFLVIRELAPLLRNGDGRVVIWADECFKLVSYGTRVSLPSAFFSYAKSQMCLVLLGVGAKNRYPYLDTRIVSGNMTFTSVINREGVKKKLFKWMVYNSDLSAIELENAVTAENSEKKLLYFDGIFPGELGKHLGGCERANDLWEQAEMIS